MRVVCLMLLLTLTACGEWPDAGFPPLERQSTDWPSLLPISQIVEGNAVPVAEDRDAARLAARAAALQNRARILRANAEGADAMEALRARLRR
ncbi:hypothetical protein N9C96_00235 [bacterium]|nr:hypothetical protein [bacterium]